MQVKPTNKHEMKAKLEPERGVWEGVDREKESFLCTLYENRKKKKNLLQTILSYLFFKD